jgi:hypothetical protein
VTALAETRNVAPHFGHSTMACCAGVIDDAFVEWGTGDELAAGCAAVPFFAVAAFCGMPPAFPGDEFSAIANSSGQRSATIVQRGHVRSRRYPVQQYRCFVRRMTRTADQSSNDPL